MSWPLAAARKAAQRTRAAAPLNAALADMVQNGKDINTALREVQEKANQAIQAEKAK